MNEIRDLHFGPLHGRKVKLFISGNPKGPLISGQTCTPHQVRYFSYSWTHTLCPVLYCDTVLLPVFLFPYP